MVEMKILAKEPSVFLCIRVGICVMIVKVINRRGVIRDVFFFFLFRNRKRVRTRISLDDLRYCDSLDSS